MADQPRHVIVVSCLVRNTENQILMIRHCKRGWEIPQGRVEEGEDLISAVHREVREETGVSIHLGPLAVVSSKLSAPPAVIFCFLGRYLGGELKPSEETPEVGWFNETEALPMISHPVNLDRVKALVSFSGIPQYCGYTVNPYRMQSAVPLVPVSV